MRLRLRTLGELSVSERRDEGDRGLFSDAKILVLAAYLATRPEHRDSRDHLAELFWLGSGRVRSRRSLRQALYMLRERGAVGLIESENGTLHLNADLADVDLWRFEAALASQRWEEAVQLHRGPFLPRVGYPDNRELQGWLDATREKVHQGLRLALQRLCEAAIASGSSASAVGYAAQLADTFPLDDRAQETLVRVLTEAGRPGQAIRAYEAFKALLRSELDDEPSAELQLAAEEAARRARTSQARSPASAESDGVPGPALDAPDVTVLDLPGARSRRVPVLVGLAVVALVTAGTLITVSSRARRTPVVEARLYVQTADGGRVLRWSGDSPGVVSEEGEFDEYSLVSPDGNVSAARMRTPSGRRIQVVDLLSGDPVARIPDPDEADQHEQVWSPDSRKILYLATVPGADASSMRRLYVFDLESGSTRQLGNFAALDITTADWSPSGTRIVVNVLQGAATDLFLVDANGTEVTRLTHTPAAETEPRWSPDGTRLVYVTDESGSPDVAIMNADGTGQRRVTRSRWVESSPVWLDESRIAYVSDRDGQRDLWLANADTSEDPVRLTRTGGLVRIASAYSSRRSAVLESVRIGAAVSEVSPGEMVPLDVELAGDSNRVLPPTEIPLRWDVLEPERGSLSFEDGPTLHVAGEGRVRVVADAGGWRADTLALCSRPVAAASPPILLEDDWSAGIRDGVWMPFGSPAPGTRAGQGPEGGGLFLNNGDGSYNSGVVSVDRFPTADGLTLEVWGRLPLTDSLYQSIRFGLSEAPEIHPDGERYEDRFVALVRIGRITGGGTLGDVEREVRAGLPPGHDAWRLYALQLHPDGQMDWIIDGRRHIATRASKPIPDSVHVVLHGRSRYTEAAHGTVRVRRGLRFVAGGDPCE